ncbi:MAG TPA: hypothetical protein PKJ74_09435 [Chitinophagales bacterium]|nr:hypothetical protein [Chitinophagales bacterium]HNL17228.1 hypothetical protein [Chitinophagales bacterium]HNM67671.1 hypothetical protein [Chitinophagales bacterium]HNO48729.1 hypothetical protein [Chitinophagales bacterium]
MIIPNVALTATNAAAPVASPATSLLVYNTATAGTAPNNVTPGYYYWDGAKWVKFMVNNNNTIDLGYILGWTSNTAPPDYLLPLNGGTYNWADYPDFKNFHTAYPCQFIASSTGTTFTLVDINTSGRFLRGNTGAGVLQNGSTALPTTAFTTNTTGAHTHSVDPPSTTTSSNGEHSHQLNLADNGYPDGSADRTNNYYMMAPSRGTITTNNGTFGAGAHTHTLDIAAFNSASAGDHLHSITGGDVETRPINTSVIWCIKVKPTATSGDITIVNTANTAINGLSVYGTAVGLGGNLNQNTIISNLSATNKLNFIGSGVNMFNVDGTTLSVDGDNDRVGIGTTTPTQKLQVEGNTLINGSATLKSNGGILNIHGTNHGYIQWYPQNTTRKAWTGYGSSGAEDFTIANEVSGKKILLSTTGAGSGVQVNSLAGTGNRPVYADASGTLNTKGSNFAYYKGAYSVTYPGSKTGNAIFTNAVATTNLQVEIGDVVYIQSTFKTKFGGSGIDEPRFVYQIAGSCGTINIADTYQWETADNISRENHMNAHSNIWVANCSGTITVKLGVIYEDMDDTITFNDLILTATRH